MGQLESASMNFKHNNTTLNMYTTRLLEHVIGKTYNRGMYIHTRFEFLVGHSNLISRFVQLWSLIKKWT